jgi:hypothetical protein
MPGVVGVPMLGVVGVPIPGAVEEPMLGVVEVPMLGLVEVPIPGVVGVPIPDVPPTPSPELAGVVPPVPKPGVVPGIEPDGGVPNAEPGSCARLAPQSRPNAMAVPAAAKKSSLFIADLLVCRLAVPFKMRAALLPCGVPFCFGWRSRVCALPLSSAISPAPVCSAETRVQKRPPPHHRTPSELRKGRSTRDRRGTVDAGT